MAGERILVCDDDPQILRALRLVLRGAGYEVLTSATAEEALDRAALAGPHAAIIDLMLPDRPGIEVCRELRAWSEMPIIVLSAVSEEETKIAALQSGADDYVTKPFGPGVPRSSHVSRSMASWWMLPRTPWCSTVRRYGSRHSSSRCYGPWPQTEGC